MNKGFWAKERKYIKYTLLIRMTMMMMMMMMMMMVMVMVMKITKIMTTMVLGLRKSCGLRQLMRDGLLT